jgi:hypothetical protein
MAHRVRRRVLDGEIDAALDRARGSGFACAMATGSDSERRPAPPMADDLGRTYWLVIASATALLLLLWWFTERFNIPLPR